MVSIIELSKESLEEFFQYLTIQLSENGQEGKVLFAPLSKEQSVVSAELRTRFMDGLEKEFGENGWRKAWIAINQENKIIGHIDIRSNNQKNSNHRVLLGMGVDSNFRGLKIGFELLNFIINYCRNDSRISWIDLEVFANNFPAKSLYHKMGFVQLSETKDMFRVDNISYDYNAMTLNVEK